MATKRATKKKAPANAKAKEAHVFDRADHEWYVDTPSVSDALFRVENFPGAIFDPCAGMGNIVRSAVRHGYSARAYDVNPRPEHFKTLIGVLERSPVDFLSQQSVFIEYQSIVMNPPYGQMDGQDRRWEEAFIERAVDMARGKVAAVVRLQWLVPRMAWLKKLGLIRVWLITSRPSMLPGENIKAGERPGGGGVDYAWCVFIRGADVAPTIGAAERQVDLDDPKNWTWRLG